MSDPLADLEKNENGNIITKPVTGWITGTVAESGILLAIQYIEMPSEFGIGRKSIQFALTVQQTLDLVEVLTKLTKRLLNDKSSAENSVM